MALKPRHWIGLTALGCAIVAIAYLPPDPERLTPRFVTDMSSWEALQANRPGRLARTIQATQWSLRMLKWRDSIPALARRNGRADNGPGVVVDPTYAPRVGALIDTSVQAEWSRIAPPGDLRVIVAVLRDTTRGRFAWQGAAHFTPKAMGTNTCLSVIVLHGMNDGNISYTIMDRATVRGLFGPCAFYAAFGPPGDPVEALLQGQDFQFARISNWQTPIWHGFIAPRGRECGHGDLASCRAFLRNEATPGAEPGTEWEPPRWPVGIAGVPLYTRSALDHFFADLVRDKGRERFARFWRSTLPPDSAFAAAFGEPMDAWTSRWIASLLKRDDEGMYFWGIPAGVHTGVRAGTVLVTLLLVVALVGGGTYYSQRRQVA